MDVRRTSTRHSEWRGDQYFLAGLVVAGLVAGGLIVLLVIPEPVVPGLAMQDCPLFLALSQDAIVW